MKQYITYAELSLSRSKHLFCKSRKFSKYALADDVANVQHLDVIKANENQKCISSYQEVIL